MKINKEKIKADLRMKERGNNEENVIMKLMQKQKKKKRMRGGAIKEKTHVDKDDKDR